MFAVKCIRRRKFLRGFSGSFNSFRYRCSYKLQRKLGRAPTAAELWREMFSAGPDDAKVYRTKAGAENSFYSCRYKSFPVTEDMEITKSDRGVEFVTYDGERYAVRRYSGCEGLPYIIRCIPLVEALPSLRIVPVRVKA